MPEILSTNDRIGSMVVGEACDQPAVVERFHRADLAADGRQQG
jgi:hypothetical protein